MACLNSTACTTPPPRTLVIHAGRVFDGLSQHVQTHQRITVHDGNISEIVADSPAPLPAGAAEIDARNLTVLPGLIDAHTHVLGSPACTPGMQSLGQTVRNLHAYLRAGITTAADLNGPQDLSLSVRRYAGNGEHRGPRLLVCGPALRAPGGYPQLTQEPNAAARGLVRDIHSAEQARTVVRELADAGVDCIKIYLQEEDFDGAPLPVPDDATLCAMVHEAHRQELRAFVHAVTDASYRRALSCGADALVHGSGEPLSAATQSLLLAHPTPVLPTHWVFEGVLRGPEHMERLDSANAQASLNAAARADLQAYAAHSHPNDAELPAAFHPHIARQRLADSVAARLDNTRWLAAHQLPVAFGSDSAFCFNWAGDPAWELQRFVDAGMSAAAALRAATSGSAAVLNLQDALGRVAPHFRADLVAVAGNPDEDVRTLDAVAWVMVDGIVQNTQGSWYEPALLAWEVFRTWISA